MSGGEVDVKKKTEKLNSLWSRPLATRFITRSSCSRRARYIYYEFITTHAFRPVVVAFGSVRRVCRCRAPLHRYGGFRDENSYGLHGNCRGNGGNGNRLFNQTFQSGPLDNFKNICVYRFCTRLVYNSHIFVSSTKSIS